MGLEAYATVINVSPDDVARANERLQEHPAGSDLDPFTRWQDPANAQVTTAWVAFHEPLFWQGHRSGDWPQILKQLEAVQAAWPGKD